MNDNYTYKSPYDISDPCQYDYKSPINIYELTPKIENDQENMIFKAIQQYGITVDKEELIKALNYDRKQYEKGFARGYIKANEDLKDAYRVEKLINKMLEMNQCNSSKTHKCKGRRSMCRQCWEEWSEE